MAADDDQVNEQTTRPRRLGFFERMGMDWSSFEGRMYRLHAAYWRGVDVRRSMQQHGQAITHKSANEMYAASGATRDLKTYDGDQFTQQHVNYFYAGVMGLPEPGSDVETGEER